MAVNVHGVGNIAVAAEAAGRRRLDVSTNDGCRLSFGCFTPSIMLSSTRQQPAQRVWGPSVQFSFLPGGMHFALVRPRMLEK